MSTDIRSSITFFISIKVINWNGTEIDLQLLLFYCNDPKFLDWYVVQTQIRLLLDDQGLHCLPFRLHPLDSLLITLW